MRGGGSPGRGYGGQRGPRDRRDRSRSRSPFRGNRGGPDGGKMVYVSNLPYEMRWIELKSLLREHGGELSFVEILEERNGRSKGCAIAEFRTRADAEKCVKSMSPHVTVNGRNVIVKEIRDPVSFLRKIQNDTGIDYLAKLAPGGGQGRSSNIAPERSLPQENYETYGLSMEFLRSHNIELPLVERIFVANVPFTIQTGRMCDIFGMAGRIAWIDQQLDKEGRSKGTCIIEYSHPLEAVQAVSMFHNQKLLDRNLLVKLDRFNKTEDRKPGELPRGLNTIGMGLGADGAPLTDIQSVLSSLGKAPPSSNVAVPTATPVPVPPPSFGTMGFRGNFGGPDPAQTRDIKPDFNAQAPFGGLGSFGGISSGQNLWGEPKHEAAHAVPSFNTMMGGAGGVGGPPSTGFTSRAVIIKNLPHDYTWQIVSDRVSSFGDVDAIEMVSPGTARIRYTSMADADRARQALNGMIVEGRNISVEYVY